MLLSQRRCCAFNSFIAVKAPAFLLALAITLLSGFDWPAAFADEAWFTLSVTSSPNSFTRSGQVITYTYVITDSYGSPGVISALTDDKATITDCPANTTVPLAGLTCHGTYTTTATDVSNGSITNHATVSGDACNDGCQASATAQDTISFVAKPSWKLAKTAQPSTYTAAGQTIKYSYLLTNTGNVSISAISLTDDKISGVSCPASSIAAGAHMTCTGSYVTTNADVTAGSVSNTATSHGTPAAGTLADATAVATITLNAKPAWRLTKTAQPKTYTAAGQTIKYSYLLTNTGNVSISAISLTDDKISGVSCPATSIAAGARMTCTASYVTTNADVSAGSVSNTATSHGTPAAGTLADATAAATITLNAKPSWTLTKTAEPTTYTAAGQTINYSYALTNTGDVSISAISLTDDKISAVSCPAASLAGGATMTCHGSYVTTTTDVANHRVVNIAIASGTAAGGSLAAAKARATIRFAATSGSITIVTTASGGNGSFSFASTLPAAKAFSLTTVSGKASRTFRRLKPGTYVVSENDLPANWKLTALSCTGDSGGRPTVVDLGNRSVSIGLDSSEAIICTFGNAFNNTTTVKKTKDMIARFLGHRLQMLLDQEPDRARFLRRVPGALWGDAYNGSNGGSGRPFNFDGASNGLGSDINFSTSLMQISRASAYSDEKSGTASGKNALASMPAKAAKPPILLDTGVDVWMEAHYRSYSADSGGVQNNGYFGILYAGADYLVAPSTLIGALVQFDWMKENTSTLGNLVDGRGAMAGPYLSLRLTPELFVDSRIAWGLSRNDINPFGTYTDSFSTDRWLAHARLTGNWRFGDFRVTPSVAFDYGQEHQQSYTDSKGQLISGQMVSLGRISAGPEFARRFVLDNGAIFEPLVSLTGKWDVANGTYASAAGLPTNGESVYLKVAGGFMARAPGGYSMRLVGSYDGLGNPAFQSWGGEVSVNIPLH